MSRTDASRRSMVAGLASLPMLGATTGAAKREEQAMGFTAQGLAGVRETLQGHVAKGFVPGAVALIDRGGATETFAVGTKALSGAEPMARDTLFRIASMTKLVTAAAVMMLIEEGRLKLDEPVDRLLPELANRRVLKAPDAALSDTVPASRPITVADLLSFRLGLGIVLGPPTWPIVKAIADLGIVGFGAPNPRMPLGPDEWMGKLATLPLLHQPGEAWMYTLGADIQGVLVARATRQRFDDFVHERILAPLAMHDTGFSVPPAKLHRLCTAYASAPGGKLAIADDPASSMYAQRPRFPEGDSGLTSTVDDLLTFSRMLLAKGAHGSRRILSAASVQAMTANHLTAAQTTAANGQFILGGHGWGYGMSVVGETPKDGLAPGDFGWNGGYGTSWYMDPARGLTMILLTQRLFDTADPPAIHKDFWAASYRALA